MNDERLTGFITGICVALITIVIIGMLYLWANDTPDELQLNANDEIILIEDSIIHDGNNVSLVTTDRHNPSYSKIAGVLDEWIDLHSEIEIISIIPLLGNGGTIGFIIYHEPISP